jgi:hypothetical protein
MFDNIPQHALFNGKQALLVIDKTKLPYLCKNDAIESSLGAKESPSLVAGDELSTDGQDRDVVNQENIDPQANQPPHTNNKGPKRKEGCLEMDSEVDEEQASSASSSTKRRKNVLKSRKENKSAPAKSSSSGEDKKLFECHLCVFTSRRGCNLTTHIKTHDPNRVKEFICPKCEKRFTRKHDQESHFTNAHK